MARVAVEMLLVRLASPGNPHEHRRFGVELVVGGSTGCAPPPEQGRQ
ncbi:hypothetical protein ACU61A_40005 [Pseudonocardia sichuanensis]